MSGIFKIVISFAASMIAYWARGFGVLDSLGLSGKAPWFQSHGIQTLLLGSVAASFGKIYCTRGRFKLINASEVPTVRNKIVQTAREVIISVGSESRSPQTLHRIVEWLISDPKHKHYRILGVRPTDEVYDYLNTLLLMCGERTLGVSPTLCISMSRRAPKGCSICANEKMVLLSFDVGREICEEPLCFLLCDTEYARQVCAFVETLFVHGNKIHAAKSLRVAARRA